MTTSLYLFLFFAAVPAVFSGRKFDYKPGGCDVKTEDEGRIVVLHRDSTGDTKAGDVYMGAKYGVFYRNMWKTIVKISNITDPVAAIYLYYTYGVFVRTTVGQLHFIESNRFYVGVQQPPDSFVLSVAVIQKNGTRKAGDLYVGTSEGLYSRDLYADKFNKIEGINYAVDAIYIDLDGGAYVRNCVHGTVRYINKDRKDEGVQNIDGNVDTIETRYNGDVYVGTTYGVYFKKYSTTNYQQIIGIPGPVAGIYFDFNGGLFVRNLRGKLYYLDDDTDNRGVQQPPDTKVLSVGILQKDAYNGTRKAGDLYIATDNGVYLKQVGVVNFTKMGVIDQAVIGISVDDNGGAYAVTFGDGFYHIDYAGNVWQLFNTTTIDDILKAGKIWETYNKNSTISV